MLHQETVVCRWDVFSLLPSSLAWCKTMKILIHAVNFKSVDNPKLFFKSLMHENCFWFCLFGGVYVCVITWVFVVSSYCEGTSERRLIL